MYQKHQINMVIFSGSDVFVTAGFASDTDEDIYDEFSIKPNMSDI